MNEFLRAAFDFPAALFSFALLVVVGYWVLVLIGGLGSGAFEVDADTGAGVDVEGGGLGGWLAGAGLGGVPVTVALSLLIALSWFAGLVGGVLLDAASVGGPMFPLGKVGLLGVALLTGWGGTWLAIRPLRRVFAGVAESSRRDFVGRLCVIRTGRVGTGFGQAEVTAADGSTALVQVRLPEMDAAEDGLGYGSTALIFDYDAAGEVFLVMRYDPPISS